MLGINCLQDLKKKLAEAGFEILGSHGWYLDTAHGCWTMAQGVVYLNNTPIKSISEAKILKKIKIKSTSKKKKIKSFEK